MGRASKAKDALYPYRVRRCSVGWRQVPIHNVEAVLAFIQPYLEVDRPVPRDVQGGPPLYIEYSIRRVAAH